MKRFSWIVLAVAVASSNSAFAAAKSGVHIGSVKLTESKDRDVIVLPSCRTKRNQKVSELAINVTRAPAEIDTLKVVYYNGEHQTLNVKDHFKVNSSSRWIDLNGSQRCIAKIIVKGDADTALFRPKKQSKVSLIVR